MPTTVSPLRYPGGKTQFYTEVVRIIKDNGLLGCTYLEGFAGGSSVALKLLFDGIVAKVILNDRDRAIYSFWNEVLTNCDAFCEKVRTIPLTIEEWRRQKATYLNPNAGSSDLGFAAFYLNRTNRSGIIFANPIGGIGQNNVDYDMGCRFNREKLVMKIKAIHEKKDKIQFHNLDAIAFIDQFKGTENSFWFLDPPYFLKGKQLYSNYYKKEDHSVLAIAIKRDLADAKWILTYDVCEDIKKLYERVNLKTIQMSYSVQSKRKSEELLFFNGIHFKSSVI